jgi:hypothetical protein
LREETIILHRLKNLLEDTKTSTNFIIKEIKNKRVYHEEDKESLMTMLKKMKKTNILLNNCLTDLTENINVVKKNLSKYGKFLMWIKRRGIYPCSPLN